MTGKQPAPSLGAKYGGPCQSPHYLEWSPSVHHFANYSEHDALFSDLVRRLWPWWTLIYLVLRELVCPDIQVAGRCR